MISSNRILHLLIITLGLSACCTKKECLSALDSNEINLYGFNLDENTHIVISSYEKGSNFSVMNESSEVSSIALSGSDEEQLVIHSPINIHQDADYIIELKDIEETYWISNIQTTSEKCNDCFLTEDSFNNLSAYDVNDKTVTNHRLEIRKE